MKNILKLLLFLLMNCDSKKSYTNHLAGEKNISGENIYSLNCEQCHSIKLGGLYQPTLLEMTKFNTTKLRKLFNKIQTDSIHQMYFEQVINSIQRIKLFNFIDSVKIYDGPIAISQFPRNREALLQGHLARLVGKMPPQTLCFKCTRLKPIFNNQM